MRILWISHFLLYPETGYGALQRSRNLLLELCKHHDIYLICLFREADKSLVKNLDLAEIDLKKHCKNVFFVPHKISNISKIYFILKSIFAKFPYSVSIYCSKYLKNDVLRFISDENIDLIHSDTLGMIEPILDRISAIKVLNHHDIESHKMYRRYKNEENLAKRLFFWNENKCLEKYEKKYYKKYDMNIVVSEMDYKRLNEIMGKWNIHAIIVENGVDCDYFAFHARKNCHEELIFTGALDYYPNDKSMLFFCSDVWPILKKKYPKLKFSIIGKNPSKSLMSLVKSSRDIKMLGYVDDVRPHIKRAKVFVCPIKEGGGTRIKILDAFSQGVPVVSTYIGAEGLDAVNGKHLLIADTPSEFVERISDLLDNDVLSEKISRDARKFVEEKYSYKYLGKKLAKEYENLLENKLNT